MKSDYLSIFKRFVPEKAALYCYKLYEHLGFEFKIKKSRMTKLGDYRYDPRQKKHTITVNNDLNPYAFVLTYLHEVAHLVTFEKHKTSVNPHGSEWKAHFIQIVQPILNETVFPPPILLALTRYFKNPKASSCSDPTLYMVLKKFDEPNGEISLKQVPIGSTFTFNRRVFRKISKKRTRSICVEVATGKQFLINEIAPVKLTEENN